MSAFIARAQVTVEVVTEPNYLPGEELEVKVRITNLSGQTIPLGKDADWLTFSLEGRDSFIIPRTNEIRVEGELDLESSKVATRRVDLGAYYELMKPGRYTAVATVKIPRWAQPFHSQPKSFDILSGVKLWEQDFGVPDSGADNAGQPEVRKYTLQKATHKKQTKLYLRVADAAESKVFRVFPLGRTVAFTKLDPQLDRFSNLHVLFQTGARTFNYTVVNPDGRLLLRQTYELAGTRPELGSDKDGNIAVGGGVRRVTATDVPTSDVNSHDSKPPPKP